MPRRVFIVSGLAALAAAACTPRATGSCIPSGPASAVQEALHLGGQGTVASLCPGAIISITDSGVSFTAPDQEISTQGYPTDDTRATFFIEANATVGNAINGWGQMNAKLLNVQVDGNRPNAGIVSDNALIEMGQHSTGAVVSNCAIRNTRTWSCLHIIGSGDDSSPCKNATITYNTVGPCGNEGTDANGNALWADGISLDCTESAVMHNTITGPTDGGIVIFGSPGAQVINNTITSSANDLGFGAINMVDPLYGGNYSGVVVTDNVIHGQGNGMFNLGVGIGPYVWSNNHDLIYFGPAVVSNNTFIGNVGFSIVINGWSDGLTAVGNDVSQTTRPTSSFAYDGGCEAQVQTSFDANEQLIVYLPDIASGPLTLQPDFTQAPDNATHWLCLQRAADVPTSKTFAAGALTVNAQTSTVCDLRDFHVQIQGDGNLVGYDTTGGVWTPKWSSGPQTSACGSDGSQCQVSFGADGDFVDTAGGARLWDTGTAGQGKQIVFSNAAPYLVILDGSGNTIWDISQGVKQ